MKTTILCLAFLLAFSIVQDECSAQRDTGDKEKLAWYGTLDSAMAEAKRTERPIFLVAARPECRGVPGKW